MPKPEPDHSVVTRDPSLAARFNLVHVAKIAPEQLELAKTSAGLALRGELASGDASLVLDFAQGSLRRRLLDAPSAPVVKALGKAARGHVIDATAGLLRDTLTVARVAQGVTAIERHPVVAALAADALDRLQGDERLAAAASRVKLMVADAMHVLKDVPRADGVMLDPMFSVPTRSTPKKDLQLLHRLLGPTHDERLSSRLLEVAKSCAAVVVVKRSSRSPALAADVHHSVSGKGFRWDVYRQT